MLSVVSGCEVTSMPLCSRQALLYQTRLAQLNEDKHKCRIVPQNGLLMPLVDDRHPLLVAGPCASAVNRLKPMEKFFGRETGKMEGIRRPRLQQGGRVRGEITSSKARGKKALHYYRQQGARSKKQGEGAVFDLWQPYVSKLGGGQKKKTDSCRCSKRR